MKQAALICAFSYGSLQRRSFLELPMFLCSAVLRTTRRRWVAIIAIVFVTAFLSANVRAQEISFNLDAAGYVKNWLVTDPDLKSHFGGRTDSGEMPDQAVAEWRSELPRDIAFSGPAPFGKPWHYHPLGESLFMDLDSNVPQPTVARMYATVDLLAPGDMEVEGRAWIGAWAHLWLNETDLGTHRKSPAVLRLALRKGRNRFVALLRHGGLRAIHLRIGLQLPHQTGKIRVLVPGPSEVTADLHRAERWIRAVELTDQDRLKASTQPPFPAEVTGDGFSVSWPADRSEVAIRQRDAQRFQVRMRVREQILDRVFELPSKNVSADSRRAETLEAHRRECLEKMRTLKPDGSQYFIEGIIRRLSGEPPVHDTERLADALHRIIRRIDCADFDLAFALRFYRLGAGTQADRQQIKTAALGFRHWQDEPGLDGMCFHSENHRLLYHGNQLISGNLWPDEVFTNSGKSGLDQARLGRERCLKWFDEIEPDGYEEFLSTTYAPITTAALMNLVDFSDDADISRRAARQVDAIYRMLAEHTFDSTMIGPQGRTSRRMLYPYRLGTQSLLSYAVTSALPACGPWTIFVASSPRYRPPEGLESLMTAPAWKRYRQAYYLLNLKKTTEYMLSSVEIPASARDPSFHRQLVPGGHGYQQHIWHATLGRDCHVFTTHPGTSDDIGDGRPGFWTGNAVFPRQTQNSNTLLQIFSIPTQNPIQFTHAYWPADAFDVQHRRGHWSFGRLGKGYIALWCSTVPELRSGVLANRELRAWGDRMAWVCMCSSESESGSFESFMSFCERQAPEFDPDLLRLSLSKHEPLDWLVAHQN